MNEGDVTERGLQPRRQDHRRRVSGGGGGVVLWDAAARAARDEPLAVTEGDVDSVAFSPDGKTLAAGYGVGVGGASAGGGAVGRGRDANGWPTSPSP